MWAWVDTTATPSTAGGICPRCGWSLANDGCRSIVTTYRRNYFSDEPVEPEPHRTLIVDNWHPLQDAAPRPPSLRSCRLWPEARAPPVSPVVNLPPGSTQPAIPPLNNRKATTMAKRGSKRTPKQRPEGHADFVGPDAEMEALEKIANSAKAANAKAGHNTGGITDRDAWRRAANECLAEDLEIERLQEQIAESRGRLSAIRKVAKSRGVDWDVVASYRKLQKRVRNGEMGTIVTEHRLLGELLGIMESPLFTQYDLFKTPAAAENGAAASAKPGMDAELQGQHSYSNNEPLVNNPFTPGTEDFVAWEDGWKAAERATAMKMAPKASAEATAH